MTTDPMSERTRVRGPARLATTRLLCTLLLAGWGGLQTSAALAQSGAPAGGTPPAAAASTTAVEPLTLTQAYQAALGHDAVYRAAGHEAEYSRLGVRLARASLLPSLNLSASKTSAQGWRQFPNSQNQEVRTRLDYDAPQAALQLRVPVFNWDALSSYRISRVQSEAADLIYSAQSVELLDRVSEAYIRTVMAKEASASVREQVRSIELQLAQIEQRAQSGEGTKVQVAQTRASLDLARARQAEADDAVELAARQLQRATGLRGPMLQTLPAPGASAQPPVERLGDWLDKAVRQSIPLQARARSVEVAKLAVTRQYAGHLPRLDIVATLSRSENDSVTSLGQTTSQRSIGVQLNVPLYSGGGVDASIRQAASRHARADEDLRDERENLELDIQRFYQAATNGARTVAAYQQAVTSAELAWQGTRRALELGVGTLSDAAQAQAAYYSALRDLAQARSDQLMARVRLMARAGMAPNEITGDVDDLLSARSSAAPTR